MIPSHPSDGASHARALAPSLAIAAGVLAAANTTAACLDASIVRDLDAPRWIGALILFVISVWRAIPFAGESSLARTGVRLAAAAIVAFGAVEKPAWVSVDTFGITLASSWLAVAALAMFYLLERTSSAAAAGALGLIVFSAFGGPFFVRDGDDYHTLLALFAIAALAAAPLRSFPRRGVLFSFVIVLLALLLAPLLVAVDRDRHLEVFLRACTAFALLPLCAAIAERREQESRAFALSWLGISALAVLAALSAIVEGGMRFEFAQALRVRLPLFGEHPNIVAPYFAVAVPLLLAIASSWRRFSAGTGVAALVIAAGCAIALGSTRSRAAAGGLAVGLVLWFVLVFLRRTRTWFRGRSRILAASLLSIVVVVGAAKFGSGFVTAKLNDASMAFRIYMWETAASAIADRPLVGYGLHCAEPLMNHATEGDLDGRTKDTHPHMLLLALAMGAGIPAAAVYALLALTLVFLAGRRAVIEEETHRAAIGAGIAASTLVLFTSNLLDQGLALHTPIPLHLGLLLGAYVLAFGFSEARRESPFDEASTAKSHTMRALLLGALLIVSLDAIATRLLGASREPTRQRDHATALALTEAARWIDPWDVEVRLAHADALDHAGERAAAAEEFARLTDLVPFSPYPWERLANLEYDRRQLQASLMALERAKRLDPTGPSTSQWTLRMGNLYANLGDRDKAMEAIAEAVRYDFAAAQRAGWLQDGQKEYYIPVANAESPIFLSGVLKRNRDLLPELVARDPIKARRLATTIAKIEMTFRRYRAAREAINLYRSLTDVPWLPLEHLAAEIARLEASDPRPDATPVDPAVATAGTSDPNSSSIPDVATPVDAEDDPSTRGLDDAAIGIPRVEGDDVADAFAAASGRSILYVDRAHARLLAGDPDGAEKELERGLAATYDIVAEREAIAVLLGVEIECAMYRKDVAAAKRATNRALYFQSRPGDRLALVVTLGQFLVDQNDVAGALECLDESLRYLSFLGPERGGRSFESASRFVRALLGLAGATEGTRDRLSEAAQTGPGLVLACLAFAGTPEGTTHFQRLKREFPDWLPALRAPR